MNQNKLKTVIREFLSSDKGSPVIGDKYKNTFLNKRQEYIGALLTNKRNLVKRYGKRVKAIRLIWNSPSTFGGIGDVFSMIKRCIHEIHDGDKVYNKVDMSDKELDEFLH